MVSSLLRKRPIMVGGLGLTASLWLLQSLNAHLPDGTMLTGAIALSAGVWWLRHRPSVKPVALKPMTPVARASVEAALGNLDLPLATLGEESQDTAAAEQWQGQRTAFEAARQALHQALDRTTLSFALVGAPRTGKSTLRSHLATDWTTAPTLTEINRAQDSEDDLATVTLAQDAVLYVITEDLTDSALQEVRSLTAMGQRVGLVLNKTDHYLPEDRAAVTAQLQQRMQASSPAVDVVAVMAAPNPLKVRTHLPDGQVQERWETPEPDVQALRSLLARWITEETPHLVTQTVMRQTQQLRQEIQKSLNQVRRDRALPVVEQLQWVAAATAFASPMPTLDVLATAAINGQLILDLGRIYRQPLSLDQAQATAGTLAALVVKLGLVEVSTQVLTTALKSHAATFVVGGGVQGLSAAYLTRMAGESLMTYFEERALSGTAETALSVNAIAHTLQGLMQQTQPAAFLQKLVNQGIQRFAPMTAPAALPAGTLPAVVADRPKAIALPQPEPVPMAQSEAVVHSGDLP